MSESLDKLFVHISPSSLDDMQKCHRQYGWRNYITTGENVRRDEGSVFHTLLKHFYRSLIKEPGNESIAIDLATTNTRSEYLTDESIPVELVERCIEIFNLYTESTRPWGWIPLHAEKPTSRVLFENDSIQILFELISDLVILRPGEETPIPVDHKTSDRFDKRITSRTNQFLGTCWTLDSNLMIFNRAGFQKNDPPGGRFQAFPISFPDSVISDWRENTILSVLRYVSNVKAGIEETNNSSCWNCRFHDVCMIGKEAHSIMLEQDFVYRKSVSIYERAK